MLDLSRAQARRLLAAYQFTPTDLPGVFARLGTVQYDPLNPVGRNPDLILQARVPGYKVDDWQHAAYTDRIIYDAWDKMACLVPVTDWPNRALLRDHDREYWHKRVLGPEAEAVAAALDEIDRRGPLSSLEFEDQAHFAPKDSWYGPKRIKHILRALWDTGAIVTHHRQGGRHYYDRPERTLPVHVVSTPPLLDTAAHQRWLIHRRFQTAGLMRTNTEANIWYGCGAAPSRRQAISELVDSGLLVSARVEGGKQPYYMTREALAWADTPVPQGMRFVAPLDGIMWDRKGVLDLFGFDYRWEVYKPKEQRQWGYYVLPVFYGDRFVARIDSVRQGKVWLVHSWLWESDVTPDADLLAALGDTGRRFMTYLSVDTVRCADGVEPSVRAVLENL